MASGKTHDFYTYASLLPVGLVCWYGFGLSIGEILAILIGLWIGGIYLSPDLDTRSRPFYRWGVFRFIWWPYQWMVKHRGFLSHSLFIAPLLRLIYLSSILILTYLALVNVLDTNAIVVAQKKYYLRRFLTSHTQEWILLGVGVWLGSFIHLWLDGMPSLFKKKRS